MRSSFFKKWVSKMVSDGKVTVKLHWTEKANEDVLYRMFTVCSPMDYF
ncbi:MAG: hypothetical protein GF313_09550 [Caldithrix sp.]|nr:hypothetical protein [Caldithrix sp.]